MQYVLFRLGKEEYGFNIKNVQEIVLSQEHTKIPNAPEFVEGVINLRGKVIPVLNLARKFKSKTIEDDQSNRLIVLNLNKANNKQIAIKASEVTEVRTINEENIDEAPSFNEKNNNVLLGIAKLEDKLIMIIDANKIIDAGELAKLKEN